MRIKGIVSTPMPREWYSPDAVVAMPDETDEQKRKKDLYSRVVADKKPYFMRYIYPDVHKMCKTYESVTNGNCVSRWRVGIEKILSAPDEELTPEQREFKEWYYIRMPVGIGPCAINRICRMFEDEFTDYMRRHQVKTTYDYRGLPEIAKYTRKTYDTMAAEQPVYGQHIAEMVKALNSIHVGAGMIWNMGDNKEMHARLVEEEGLRASPNIDAVGSAALAVCLRKKAYMHFAWDVFGEVLIKRMLVKMGWKMRVPVRCDDGDIIFGGKPYRAVEITVEENTYSDNLE